MRSYQTSYSKNNTYIKCPKAWYYSYVKKLKPKEEGASLFFGSAVDSAVETMLLNKGDWNKEFKNKWYTAYNFGKKTMVYDNQNIAYSHKDFDEHVLEDSDFKDLVNYAKQLKLGSGKESNKDIIELYKKISKIKKNPYKKFTTNMSKFFKRASWLSLQRKGLLLLDAFYKQFYPKVKRVIDVQHRAELKDPRTGDKIMGFVDMVLEIEGYDKPIIFDLKTAAKPYTDQQIELTDQLTLYAAMKGKHSPSHADPSIKTYDTSLVGYVVLCKDIQKNTLSICKKCGKKKNSQHRSCDAEDKDGNRCYGEWDTEIELDPQVQVLVQEKTQEQINDTLNDVSNLLLAMKHGIVYKNTSQCHNWYGSKCPFFNACHNGDSSGLVKK